MKPFRRNKSGQNIIEYSLLLILVMAGVYVMGPYVIRAWNAQVKGWEDSIEDSHSDQLLPPGATPTLNPPCDCLLINPCGLTTPCCGQGTCQSFEDSRQFICTPLGSGCNPNDGKFTCTPDENCCGPWQFLP